MLINLRNALMSGKRKPTAKDYAGFNDSVFFFDGIENAGLGVHVDTLPVAYGQSQWKNLAPYAATASYNMDMDVVGMTPAANGMSFASNSAWAAWGYVFNTSKISQNNSANLLASIFNPQDGFSAEVVFSIETAPAGSFANLSGHNEHKMGIRYSSGTGGYARFPYTRNGERATVVREFDIPLSSTGTFCLTITQNANQYSMYKNGQLHSSYLAANAYNFFMAMFALNRQNGTNQNTAAGAYYRASAIPRVLAAQEIAANYALDVKRFNIPTT